MVFAKLPMVIFMTVNTYVLYIEKQKIMNAGIIVTYELAWPYSLYEILSIKIILEQKNNKVECDIVLEAATIEKQTKHRTAIIIKQIDIVFFFFEFQSKLLIIKFLYPKKKCSVDILQFKVWRIQCF